MKDNFSQVAGAYARFRPEYPAELYKYLFSLVPGKGAAWDCATGNGQVAVQLASFFDTVFATDISSEQLAKASQKSNIIYRTEAAEQSGFAAHAFDLVTVAQAIHWFDFDAFYAEVKRTLKQDGICAVIGYGLLSADNEPCNALIRHFYEVTLNGCWDIERRFIDAHYQTIPFPFRELTPPVFDMAYRWNKEQLLGYLGTWSAVQHYKKQQQRDPLELFSFELNKVWGDRETIEVRFPLLLRVGK